MHRAIAVSADRAAPARPTRPREKPASRRGRAKSGETRTVRWRELDSNDRFVMTRQGPVMGDFAEFCRQAIPGVLLRGTESLLTHRWREVDSNHQSRSCEKSLGCCRKENPDR